MKLLVWQPQLRCCLLRGAIELKPFIKAHGHALICINGMKLHLEKASWLIVVVDFVWQTELAGEFTIVAESLYIIFVAPKSAMIYKCKRLGSSFDTRYLDVCKHAQRRRGGLGGQPGFVG